MSPWLERAIEYAITGSIATLMAIFTWLIRQLFERTHADLVKIASQIEILSKQLQDQTTKLALVQQELKALWRFADGSFARASDRSRGNELFGQSDDS